MIQLWLSLLNLLYVQYIVASYKDFFEFALDIAVGDFLCVFHLLNLRAS